MDCNGRDVEWLPSSIREYVIMVLLAHALCVCERSEVRGQMFCHPTAVKTCAGWLTLGESQLWWLPRHVEHRFDACVTKEQTGINGAADGTVGGSCGPPLFLLSAVFEQTAIDTEWDQLNYTCTTSET